MSEGELENLDRDRLLAGPGLRSGAEHRSPLEGSIGLAGARRADSRPFLLGPGRRERVVLVIGLGLAAILMLDGVLNWGEAGWFGWAARLSWGVLIGFAIFQSHRLARAQACFIEAVGKGPAPLLLTDGAGQILLSNQHANRMLKIPAGGLVGRPLEDLFPERHRASLSLDRGLLLDGGAGSRGKRRELELLGSDGTEQSIQIEQRLLHTLQGPVIQIACLSPSPSIGFEESGRARAKSMFEIAQSATVELDPAGSVVAWNAAAAQLYGRPASEMLGQPLWLVAPPERERELKRIVQRVAAGESVYDIQSEHLSQKGHRLRIALSAGRVLGKNGKVESLVFSICDQTDQSKLEAKAAQLDQALTAAMPGRARVSATGQVEWISPALSRILPGPLDSTHRDVQHESWLSLFPEGSRARLESAYTEMLARGTSGVTIQSSVADVYTLDLLLIRCCGPDDQFEGHHLLAKRQVAKGPSPFFQGSKQLPAI